MKIKKNHIKITPIQKLDKKLFNEPLTMVVENHSKKIKTVRQGIKKIPHQKMV